MSEIRNVVTTLSVDRVIEVEKEDKSISINFTLGGPICHIVVDNTGKDGRNATFEDLTQSQKDELLGGVKSDILDLGLRISILEEEIENIGAGGTGTSIHNNLTEIQGGSAGNRWHLTQAQHIIATQTATALRDGYLTKEYWSYLDKLKTYLKFTEDYTALYSTIQFYSESGVSAFGLGDVGSGSGGGVDVLINWEDYSEEKELWALSAKLGKSLLDGKKDNFADNYYSKPGHTHSPQDIIGLGDLSILLDWFEWDEVNQAIRVKHSLYSVAGLSAFGLGNVGSGGGEVDVLIDWASYDSSKESWALSAKLGVDLNTSLAGKQDTILPGTYAAYNHNHSIANIIDYVPYVHPDYGISPHTDGTLGHITVNTLNSLKTILNWFEFDNTVTGGAIKAKYTLYSVGGLSSFGLGDVGSGGGTSSVITVDTFTDISYDPNRALSSYAGTRLNTELSNKQPLNSQLTALSGLTGSGLVRKTGIDSYVVDNTSYAAGNHAHDDRYYTETEIGNYFSGAVAISGYNKSNWDTAYGWGNHASAGYALTSSLSSHMGNTSNPHSVTAAQVGAATADHNHDNLYLKLIGGEVTGDLTLINARFNKTLIYSPDIEDDILNLRRYGENHTILNILAPPQTSWGKAREATLALVRGNNNEYFLDLYNMDYGSVDAGNNLDYGSPIMGLRMQKRGTGVYTPFSFEYGDGVNVLPIMQLYPSTSSGSTNNSFVSITNRLTIGYGNASKTQALAVNGSGYFNTTLQADTSITSPAFYHSSDMRLKNVVRPLENVLNTIRNFSTFLYTEKKRPELGLQLGMSAQEFETYFPIVVDRDSEDFLMLQYPRLSVIAIKAIQELDSKQSQQERGILELENEVKLLKQKLHATTNS